MKYEGDEGKDRRRPYRRSTVLSSARPRPALITNRAQAEAAEVNAKREKSLLDQQLTTARESEVADTTPARKVRC